MRVRQRGEAQAIGLRLRRAVGRDIRAIVKLMNAAYRGAGPDASWNTEAGFISGDRTSEAALSEEMAGKPESVLLVALAGEAEDAAIQGCVWLEPVGEETWYLGSLTIAPLLQKAGLGRDLLAAAERYASERGAQTMQMKVVNVRDTLIAWYQRRGYRRTGEVHDFPYGDNRFGVPLRDDLSFVVLEKRLAEEAL